MAKHEWVWSREPEGDAGDDLWLGDGRRPGEAYDRIVSAAAFCAEEKFAEVCNGYVLFFRGDELLVRQEAKTFLLAALSAKAGLARERGRVRARMSRARKE